MTTKKRGKSKGLGAGWAAKNVERVEQAATSQLDKLEQARKELDAQRSALALGQGAASTNVELAGISTDGQTQPRVAMDEETWREYAQRMSWSPQQDLAVDPDGHHWPALELVDDGQTLWLADGFHRLHAARSLGFDRFQANVQRGTRREAIERSLGANARHGKRRTRADKRRAIERALSDPQWTTWTDARVARLCQVTSSTVTRVRQALESAGTIAVQELLVGEDGREFERPEASLPSRPPKSAKKKRAPSTSTKSTASLKKRSWEAFASQDLSGDELSFVVAYPVDAAHWSVLAESIASGAPPRALVVVPVPSGSEWIWRGPQVMDALVHTHQFEHPELVHRFGRAYFAWRRGSSANVEDALSRQGASATVIGVALDDWSTLE